MSIQGFRTKVFSRVVVSIRYDGVIVVVPCCDIDDDIVVDIVSLAAICAATADFLCLIVPDLLCILYNT